jgi:hypothetical protein
MKDKEQPPVTASMRATLKALIQQEMVNLPAQLEKMDARDRVNVLCKLMPYVFPKVETVRADHGEPLGW